jgi:hypothetical protein
MNDKTPALNEWFGAMAVVARSNGSAIWEVLRPPEV